MPDPSSSLPAATTILVANRGEIARRVVRTARRLGLATVAVYADPDERGPVVAEADRAVRIGPAELAASYLSIEAVVDAAVRTGATAVHPGYGFLSERPALAAAVTAAGLTWIGPSAPVIDQMGSKITARRLAADAGVPIIPGVDDATSADELAAAAEGIGYPVLLKAAAGGGGKGIRIVTDRADFDAALAEATAEAERSFGDGTMIVERFIQRPRHVEVQVVGDQHGSVVHLGTRECSVQRRYQKVLEEAPAPNLPDATRRGLCDSAVELARRIGYDSAGTVEFVVDGETGDYFFLEMNTRLQVEHPVTELVTGLDLVELQIRVAHGSRLPLSQDDVAFTGHAFEARINAEDPSRGFAPQIGTVGAIRVPGGVRWDAAIEPGSVITPHYDPMVAKLIVAGPDRDVARRRLAAALDETLIAGVTTNTGFHRWLVDRPEVAEATVTTRFLDDVELPPPPDGAGPARLAATAWRLATRAAADNGPWGSLGGFRLVPGGPTGELSLAAGEERHDVPLAELDETGFDLIGRPDDPTHLLGAVDGVRARWPVAVDLAARSVTVAVEGHSHTFAVVDVAQRWAPDESVAGGAAGNVVAPFPAIVVEVPAVPGQVVAKGDVVVVIEAMKMLHSLTAAGPGAVDEVRVAVGDSVASHQTLVTFTPADPSGSASPEPTPIARGAST